MARVRKQGFRTNAGVDDAEPRPPSLRVVEAPPATGSEITSLTPRERQCLTWCAEGKSYWETAVILGIAERTVSFHMEAVRAKLNAASNAHAVAVALRAGLLEPARDLR